LQTSTKSTGDAARLNMKQLIQNYRTGGIELAEVPAPLVKPGQLLIATRRSVISSGTERTITEFAGASLVSKVRQRPSNVKKMIDRMRSQGVRQTMRSVKDRLERWYPLGYCNIGTVIATGSDVREFRPGMRVACNGNHSEIVSVPKHLCAEVPAVVEDDAAAFTVLSSIALQGVRLSMPTLGERFVVIGLGLVGLLTVQILRAHGCQVLAIEPNESRASLGREFDIEVLTESNGEAVLKRASEFSHGAGIDAVLITAATESNEPIHLAASMCRKRGRIVLIGVTGLNLNRDDFYAKELSFQVSCSYGPGRYDPDYEEGGRDYPAGFVRWTEQRNFTAVLDLMAEGKLTTETLISHRFPFDEAAKAFDLLVSGESSLGIMLDYAEADAVTRQIKTVIVSKPVRHDSAQPAIALIGAGNYANHALLPAMQQAGARMHTLLSGGRPELAKLAQKYGFENLTTEADEIFANDAINSVVIATRHDSHADLAARALRAGKNVFVEKPLAITREQLATIVEAHGENDARLLIGYNRRFAPLIVKLRDLLASHDAAKSLIYTVNAGHLSENHWMLKPDVGGGRIIGEVCHFVDLTCHLIGKELVSIKAVPISGITGDDGVSATLQFADGSAASIHYVTQGHGNVPKERLEVHTSERSLLLDDFRILTGHGWPDFSTERAKTQNKGNAACILAFLKCVTDGAPAPIPFGEIIASTEAVFIIDELTRWTSEATLLSEEPVDS